MKKTLESRDLTASRNFDLVFKLNNLFKVHFDTLEPISTYFDST